MHLATLYKQTNSNIGKQVMTNSNRPQGVSVIIPTINRAEVLLDTISDMLKQEFDDFEIIVVDQSDEINDKALALMANANILCRYFKGSFKGLPQARNFGLKQAQKDILLYIDDDIRCENTLVKNHYKAHVERGAALIAGGITEKKGDNLTSAPPGSFNKWTATAIRNYSSKQSGWCCHAPGGNFSIQKSALVDIGGVDEILAVGAALYEESELALRLEKAGYKAWFEPSAHLTHLAAPMGGCRVLKNWPKYMYGLGHNRAILIFRHLRPIYWPTAILRALMLGVSYSRLDKSSRPFFAVIRGLNAGRKAAKMAPLNTNLKGDEVPLPVKRRQSTLA